MTAPPQVDIVVIGAGFAGLRMLHTMRQAGFSVTVLEAGGGIGGVWWWNRYPGARCDVESYDYSYAFSEELEQEWRWSERYAAQPELLRYIDHVADRFDLRRDIELDTRVTQAVLDESTARWTVQAEDGRQWDARHLVMAVGNLSTPRTPDIPGIEDFEGDVHHSALWPHEEVDFAGKRVGIIGTGSSAVQMTPIIAEQAAHLQVFQRTANFSVPAQNAPISDEEDAAVKARYAERREAARNSPSGLGFVPNKESALDALPEERRAVYEENWGKLGFGFALSYHDILLDEDANETAADFIREKIAEKVEDPETREAFMPRGFPFGAKRPSVDSRFYEAFNADDTELIDVSDDPIERITPGGLRTANREFELDTIIFATGFDALTGSLLRPRIVGRDGLTLQQRWAAGPTTYLGLGVHGFPNLFIIAGPGSPSLLSNVLLSIEQHVDWLARLLVRARQEGTEVIEVTAEEEATWVAHVNERALETLYPRAHSYYMGDEVPGKPRVFMPYSGGVRGYRRILEQVEADDHRGFVRTPAPTIDEDD